MKKFFLLIILGILIFACDDSSSSDAVENTDFNRSDLIATWADDFIIPELEAFETQSKALLLAGETFATTPDETNLNGLRTAWLNAYKAFQLVEKYNIGIAADAAKVNYVLNLNAYPVDVDNVISNIEADPATVNLANVLNQDAQGFPALDYMINGLAETDTEIINFYTTGENSESYTAYLTKLLARIVELNTIVLSDWKTSFRAQFVGNTSASSNGSVDQFINVYILSFEKRLRAAKVGVPLGQFTTDSFPNTIEALYKPEESKGLLLDAFNGYRKLYLGNSNKASLSNTLIDLGKTEVDDMIKLRFAEAEEAINALNVNLKAQIETDVVKMKATRDALQRIVVLLKTDMVSALGVDIIFQDNDGD